MRRVLTLLVSFTFICILGCGNRYQHRMDVTLERMREAKRLDDNLMPPPSEGKLKELAIYVRPPKNMERAKQFQLTAVPPGLFDAEETFFEGNKDFLHILARQKTAKKAATKKGAPAVEQTPRGDFAADVSNLLAGVFGDPELVAPGKFKDESQKTNKFRRAVFKANNKNVSVYFYKADPYDVALVFLVDPADQAALVTKIGLTLQSFAVGSKAKAKYDGAGSDEEAEAEAGVGAF
ncbi:MAG: hypothetical protein SFX72_02420 [Isosphaeraceae bacterium]|nr:hypothetical protein [Isosphaeraceae bacterium]